MQIEDTDSKSNKEENRLYSNYIYSIKTEVSRQTYIKCLKYYMKFLGVSTLRELVVEGKPQKIIESDIKEYLIYLRNQKKTSYVTASLYLSAVRKFYHVNSDYSFKWDLITKYLGNDDIDDNDHNIQDNNSDLLAEERDKGEEEQHGPKLDCLPITIVLQDIAIIVPADIAN